MPQRARPLHVLLTSTARYPFVQDDIDMLSRHFDLEVYLGSGVRGAWENFRRGAAADVSFCWFGSVYSFFLVLGARLARRATIIILGGVDVANEPELDYGLWRTRWKGRLLGYALSHADKVYAVDMSLRTTLERSSGRRWEHIEWLPTAYDTEFWEPQFPKVKREKMVLCVAGANALDRARIKGVDLLIDAARRLPDIPVYIIGIGETLIAQLGDDMPPNLHLIPYVLRKDLLEYYQRAQIYCQPSRLEGLPNALCEAMLCGCIPVGTDVGGIPTAIGACGFIVERENVDELCRAIRNAVAAPESLGACARDRIVTNFPKARREAELVEIITKLGSAKAIH